MRQQIMARSTMRLSVRRQRMGKMDETYTGLLKDGSVRGVQLIALQMFSLFLVSS